MTTSTHSDETCPDCGSSVLPVMYGMPGEEAMNAAERGELFLGGCMIEDVAFRCECGATSHLFDDASAEPFGIDDARAYIDEVRWQFAKTMPQWPHEYTVSDWRPELRETFLDVVRLIRTDGVVKPWPADSPTPRYHHTYLEIDGWDYWTMDDRVDDTELINRARIDET
jgi:hypothetical protein